MKLDELLKEIKDRADKATSGPWKSYDRTEAVTTDRPDDLELNVPLNVNDSNFIAHARQDIPWLLEERRKYKQALDFLKHECYESAGREASVWAPQFKFIESILRGDNDT